MLGGAEECLAPYGQISRPPTFPFHLSDISTALVGGKVLGSSIKTPNTIPIPFQQRTYSDHPWEGLKPFLLHVPGMFQY